MGRDHTREESELLRLLAEGNTLAFAEIFDRYKDHVYRAAKYFLHEHEPAKEVVQEVFLKVWKHHACMAEVKNLKGYLARMARNATYDALTTSIRKTEAEKEYATGRNVIDDTIDHLILESQYTELVQRSMEALTPAQRQVFQLCKLNGLTQEMAAQQLQISPLTVNRHMADALCLIRERLKPYIGIITYLPLFLYMFGE